MTYLRWGKYAPKYRNMMESDTARTAHKPEYCFLVKDFTHTISSPPHPFSHNCWIQSPGSRTTQWTHSLSLQGQCIWRRCPFHCCLSQRWRPTPVHGFPFSGAGRCCLNQNSYSRETLKHHVVWMSAVIWKLAEPPFSCHFWQHKKWFQQSWRFPNWPGHFCLARTQSSRVLNSASQQKVSTQEWEGS